MKIMLGSAILDLESCPKEYRETLLKTLGVVPQAVKVKVGSAEVDLEQCPKEFQEMMQRKLNLPSQAVKVDFPEEFVAYAKRKMVSKEEYVRHTARFGPPMLKEWAMMILAAAGEALQEKGT